MAPSHLTKQITCEGVNIVKLVCCNVECFGESHVHPVSNLQLQNHRVGGIVLIITCVLPFPNHQHFIRVLHQLDTDVFLLHPTVGREGKEVDSFHWSSEDTCTITKQLAELT